MGTMKLSEEQEYAMEVLRSGQESVFLSGVAGSGKSTLLKLYLEELRQNDEGWAQTAVVAPGGHEYTCAGTL
jgi:ABC-type ATPase involved in cell division